jgi:hypothetical protein
MSRIGAEGFLEIDEADMSAYADARAAEANLIIAAAFRASVLENLTALQAHAQRVSAALQDLDAAPVEAR